MSRISALADGPRTLGLRVVLREGPEGEGAAALGEERRLAVLRALLEAGHPVSRRTSTAAAGEEAPLAYLQEGALPGPDGVPSVDLAGLAPEEAVARVAALREGRALPEPGAWTPWFPVIDYQRCTNCMQCLSFCLFDVYGVDGEGRIQVRHEDNCKTNCPACSRVCPDVAILFPKYKKGPINGDVVREEDVQSESMKVDISALLGGDIYASLRERHAGARQRFSTERDESKALLERKRCLKELGETLDVPPEVLMSLPSAGEIEERAKRARAKMERHRAESQSLRDERAGGERPAAPEEWGL